MSLIIKLIGRYAVRWLGFLKYNVSLSDELLENLLGLLNFTTVAEVRDLLDLLKYLHVLETTHLEQNS